jgi:hypothetical protein
LSETLGHSLWPNRAAHDLASITLLLSQALSAPPSYLAQLVQRNSHQLDLCTRQLRLWTFVPVDRDALHDLTSRLLGHTICWTSADRALLRRLLEWLQDNQLGGPGDPDWTQTGLWQIAQGGQPAPVPALLAEWQEVMNILNRLQGVYPGAAQRMAEDLFFCSPLPQTFDTWLSRARFYWP